MKRASPATAPAPTATTGFPPLSAKDVILMLLAAGIVIAFFVLPPIEPLTQVGMRVVGVFIATVLLISLVDTTWPSILSLALFALTGVMSLNDIISVSFGNWCILFMVLSFVLADLLNNTGFINRLLAFFLSRKLVQKGPWHLTFVLVTVALIMGLLMDPTALVVFFLGFAKKLFAAAGYEKSDRYPRILSMALVFAVSIAQTMTPFSHFLVIYGLDLYSQVTGKTLGMATYMLYAVPAGLVLFLVMLLVLRYCSKPDLEKLRHLDISSLVEKTKPMERREKITVITFFTLIVFWILPEVLTLVAPQFALGHRLQDLGVTFYLIVALAFLGIIRAGGQPVLSWYYYR